MVALKLRVSSWERHISWTLLVPHISAASRFLITNDASQKLIRYPHHHVIITSTFGALQKPRCTMKSFSIKVEVSPTLGFFAVEMRGTTWVGQRHVSPWTTLKNCCRYPSHLCHSHWEDAISNEKYVSIHPPIFQGSTLVSFCGVYFSLGSSLLQNITIKQYGWMLFFRGAFTPLPVKKTYASTKNKLNRPCNQT